MKYSEVIYSQDQSVTVFLKTFMEQSFIYINQIFNYLETSEYDFKTKCIVQILAKMRG